MAGNTVLAAWEQHEWEYCLQSYRDIIYDITMRKRKVRRFATSPSVTQSPRKVQTTLRLPRQLYERAKLFVDRGSQSSVNDLIVNALTAYVRALERKTIDDSFRPMATDKQYLREARGLAEQFAASDAETIEIGERDLIGA